MKIDKGILALIICIVLLAILIIVPLVYAERFPPKSEFIKTTSNIKTMEQTIKQSQNHRDSLVKESKLILNKINEN
jgi:hypothetical protein